jgi:hypothetical protein
MQSVKIEVVPEAIEVILDFKKIIEQTNLAVEPHAKL